MSTIYDKVFFFSLFFFLSFFFKPGPGLGPFWHRDSCLDKVKLSTQKHNDMPPIGQAEE